MIFAASVHCMDGRVQEPLLAYLKSNFNVDYVDTITEPGPCKILTEREETALIESVHYRLKISIEKHGSNLVAVSGHHDCAGNPGSEEEIKAQIRESVEYLQNIYQNARIIGLWVDENWSVQKIV